MSRQWTTAGVVLGVSFGLATPARSIELQVFEYPPQTTFVPTVTYSPAWSPNGEYLAYVEFADHPHSLAVSYLGASNFQGEFLTWLPAGISSIYDIGSPTWSPDGKRIAYFYRSEAVAESGIWSVGESSRPVLLLSRPNAEGMSCKWSPMGDTIAFVERDSLWLVTVESRSIRLLKTGIAAAPGWSPDGRSLVVAARNTGLWVLDPVTGDFRQLTTHPTDRDPAWSPNGRWVAFSSNRAGHYDLWVIPAAGGEAIQLTDDEPGDGEPAWSPTGDRIAFSSFRYDPKSNRWAELWIASQLPDVLTTVAPRSWSTLKRSYR